MTTGRVEGFLPSTSGMKFTNHFPSGIPIVSIPLPIGRSIPVGDASTGVCGGMVYAALARADHDDAVARGHFADPSQSRTLATT